MSKITIIGLATVMALAAGAGWRHTHAQESVTKLTSDDYVEIYNLYAKYTRAADMGGKGDGSDWAATFTPDGTFGKAQGAGSAQKDHQRLPRPAAPRRLVEPPYLHDDSARSRRRRCPRIGLRARVQRHGTAAVRRPLRCV